MRGRGRAWRWGTALGLLLLGGRAAAGPTSDDGVVRFTYPDTTARDVHLAGDFNGWSPTATPLDREEGAWVTRVFLDAGVYEYKFAVDGGWKRDGDNPELSAKGNSVVRVGADGSVLPPQASAVQAASDTAAAGGNRLGWQIRYLSFAIARRDRERNWDLDRPVHDIDLRLEPHFATDLSGWALAHLDNRDAETDDTGSTLRFERGLLAWTPDPWSARLFHDAGVADFEDAAALVGRIGIYADAFGWRRRGIDLRRRVLGAPFEFVYADRLSDAEPTISDELPALEAPGATSLAGGTVRGYTTLRGESGADALALRARLGTDRGGLVLGYRLDRGASRGRVAEIAVRRTPGDTLLGRGREFATTESWRGWQVEARTRWRGLRLQAAFLAGTSRADAVRLTAIDSLLAAPGSATTGVWRGASTESDASFTLDRSRRAVVAVRKRPEPDGSRPAPTWAARPGSGRLTGPELDYEYEEHDFTDLVAGTPFLQRRHAVRGGIDLRRFGAVARLDLEQHWFTYPTAAPWETQFWFRRWNFWLDDDTAALERLTLLGSSRAAVARLHVERTLWTARGLRGELHATYAAPGLDRAPRYLEHVLRLVLPVGPRLELRTHSRLATYREITTDAPAVVAALGPGAHFEAGRFDLAGATRVAHGYRSRSAHYLELVYDITPRSDVALGFGVDPIVVYETTNDYAPIGWDSFLFGAGASPADAFADSVTLGARLARAERALERERRLGIEARLRF